MDALSTNEADFDQLFAFETAQNTLRAQQRRAMQQIQQAQQAPPSGKSFSKVTSYQGPAGLASFCQQINSDKRPDETWAEGGCAAKGFRTNKGYFQVNVYE
eukprot:TRINITY_DN47920_c0_g1_i1.p2 TRINITY_DN47920_c0_g1~~TRINITY_DN47920_c0_g1_i1.p2  ORF type:complete len:110 (-),score=29.11 TRINITY_DN47920_c0_g1_i1:50-352(-)